MLIRLPEQVRIVLSRDPNRRKALAIYQFLTSKDPFLLIAFDGMAGEGVRVFEAWQHRNHFGYGFMDILCLPQLEAILPSTKLLRGSRLTPAAPEGTAPIVAVSESELVWAALAGHVGSGLDEK